jgi:hypothetical protein
MFSRILTAGALFCLASTAASATTFTYNFAGTTSGYSLTKNFTSPGGPNLTVFANTVNDSGTAITPVTGTGVGVGQWQGYGLGIRNSGTDNIHTVDGLGLNDLLHLTFSASVRIVSATFAYAGVDPDPYDSQRPNDGFAFFADDGDADSSVAGDMVFSHQDIGANAQGYGTYNFLADAFADAYATTFAFAAIWDMTETVCVKWYYGKCKSYKTKSYFDSFKLKSLVVELQPPSEVPVPAGLPLLASALGIGGLLARRKASARA